MAGLSRAPRELGFRGRQVLAFVRQCIAQEGRAPSYEMIAEELRFNDRADVCRVIQRLERRGLVSRVGAGRCRRIRLAA
jgi:SOS-response transcriptional repressor LexA